ncbi:MAG: hypothetical protein IH840_00555 [Candidatus Heimdallarchaeota archaeon]|nr:hypothetical protein [Candidatus Heimdallarchaeota archaeon]
MKKIYSTSNAFLFAFLLVVSLSSATVHFPPQLVKSPADLTYEVGSTGNQLVWAFNADESDDSPSLYTVQIDGSDLIGHTLAAWQDNVDIVVNVDNLAVGDHSVTITANDTGTDDGFAAPRTDLAIVTVVEPTPVTNTTTTATAGLTTTAGTSETVGNLTVTITEGSTTIIQTTTVTKLLVETSLEIITESGTLPTYSIFFLLVGIFGINLIYRRFKV